MNKSLSVIQPILSPLWRWFESVSNFVDKFCQAFGVTLLIGMWALLMINTLARWLDVTTIGWSMEITSYMIAWSVFILMGPVTRSDEHIRVSFLPEKILGKERGDIFIFALESMAGLFLCLLLAVSSYDLIITTKSINYRIQSSGGWYYPMWIVRSGVFFGFCLSALFYLERTIKWLRQLVTGNKPGAASENPMLNVATAAAGKASTDGECSSQSLKTGKIISPRDRKSPEKEQK